MDSNLSELIRTAETSELYFEQLERRMCVENLSVVWGSADLAWLMKVIIEFVKCYMVVGGN